MSEIKLLPCPFCGVLLINTPPGRVYYHENNGCILSFRNFTIDDIEKWNSRKPMERILKKMEQEKGSIKIDGRVIFQQKYFLDIDEAIEIVKEEGGLTNECTRSN